MKLTEIILLESGQRSNVFHISSSFLQNHDTTCIGKAYDVKVCLRKVCLPNYKRELNAHILHSSKIHLVIY